MNKLVLALLAVAGAVAVIALNAPGAHANSLDDLNDTLQDMQMDRDIERMQQQNHRDNAFICRHQKRMSYRRLYVGDGPVSARTRARHSPVS